MTLDVSFGVIGKAMKEHRVIFEELPKNHIETYSSQDRIKIQKELKCVLAAPIYSEENTEPVGVLSFDGTDLDSGKVLSNPQALYIAESWADIIGKILKQTNTRLHQLNLK